MRAMKYTYLFVAILLLSSGCSEKKEDKEVHNTSEKPATAGAIEVVENKNYKEQKVAIKSKDANESKVFYYDYNNAESAKKNAPSEPISQTPVDAAIHVRSPYEHVEISLLVSGLSKEFIRKCSACHDDYANGIIGPSLLSKDGNYIYETIMSYKNGKKENILMKELVHNMEDDAIKVLADEIYKFNLEVKKLREKK